MVDHEGTTCTRIPRSDRRWGVIDLMPRSTATTVLRGSRPAKSPEGSTT